MEIQGILLKKSETNVISEKFSVQECYIDCSTFNQITGQKYENILKFQFINAKMEKLKTVQEGQRVKIKFAPQGRFIEKEDGDKFYVMNLNAWDLQLIDTNGSLTKPPQEQSFTPINMENDDLPF